MTNIMNENEDTTVTGSNAINLRLGDFLSI